MTVVRGPGRPTKGYFLANGTRVPSVTTITGRFKDSGALLRWANNEGLEGRQLYEKRDRAAEAGAIAHQWIEDFFHGGDAAVQLTDFPDTPEELVAQARVGFDAFLEWEAQIKPVVLETEMPLVSEEYRFGGTLDAVAIVTDKAVLLDWKTSGGVYPDYIVQVAGYRQLLRERDGADAPRAALLLRLGKTHADFHYHSYPEVVLDIGWEFFKYARLMYDLDRDLKKVAA